MSTKHLLDPEIAAIAELIPPFTFTRDNLPQFRENRAGVTTLGNADEHGVNREEAVVPGVDQDVRCLLYTPKGEKSGGGYLHIHGGGYIGGQVEMSDPLNTMIAAKLGAVVLTVDYRLAPEHPVPAPLDDCYAGLAWLHNNAEELGIDTKRIAVGGESAGGGLAASLAIHARDKGEFPVCHQHLTYPMLDNLTGSEAQPGDPLVGEFVWTRESNQFGWDCYLGDQEPVAPFVPSRVKSVEGLPPTWMFTAALDLFRDENIEYAQRLYAAGIATELIVMPGACHGFQFLPGTSLSQSYIHDHLRALGKALAQ
jgi:acetyl esterase/lipase